MDSVFADQHDFSMIRYIAPQQCLPCFLPGHWTVKSCCRMWLSLLPAWEIYKILCSVCVSCTAQQNFACSTCQ